MMQVRSARGAMCKGEYLDPLVDPVGELRDNKKYTLGLDLGKARDFTVLSIVESQLWESVDICKLCFERHLWRRLGVVRIERIQLGTTYPAVVERVCSVMRSKALLGRSRLVLDATGVGAPIVDAIADERDIPFIGVTLTGGESSKISGGGNSAAASISKVGLVSRLTADLQGGALSIAPGCPGAELLGNELAELRQKTSAAGRVSVAADTGEHDDAVMSLALANYFGSYEPPPFGFRGDVRLV